MNTLDTKQKIAIFDFDGTLIKGDSLWPYLVSLVGWPKCVLALMVTLAQWISAPKNTDFRTFIKAGLLRAVLRGLKIENSQKALNRLFSWVEWREDILRELKHHREKGALIVIASGGLDLYLPELLKQVPHDYLLCTKMELIDGVLTGEMLEGNCVRGHKAELVKDFIAKHGPFAESWGYGNFPHDLPLLALCDNKIIV